MAGADSSTYANFIFFGAIFLFLLQRGECISCWECNSKYDPNCGEPFKNQTIALVDCGQRFLQHYPNVPGNICRKLTQKVRGEQRIIRGCGYLESDYESECIYRAGTHQVFMQYCQCTSGDGCNSAIRNGAALALSAFLAMGVALYRM